MKLCTDKTECCGCGACIDICHTGAVHMEQDYEGFFYPQIDEKACTDCGNCRQVCPILSQSKKNGDSLYFGVQAKDEKIRYSSSSGGMFSILAQYVLEKNGIIYGAAYDKHMEVVHMEARDLQQLERIKKTKYVQSNLEGIYCRIEEQLKKNQWVLFCGTPCQAHALILYLKKPYSTLLVADLVCYGAPSPGIWKSYIKYLEQKHGGRVTEFYFRDKRNKNNGQTCSYAANGTEYVSGLGQNIYCKMYFANYILRPACYRCRFCSVNRTSDFTIGDFWNIEKVRPKADDGMGTSMVIIHTDKAKEIWQKVKDQAHWFECEKRDVLQPRLVSPTCAAKTRRLFMILYRILPFPFFAEIVRGASITGRRLRQLFKGRM